MSQRGSTRKRGSTWTAYYFVTGPDGQRVQKTKGGFRTQKDARAFLTETLVDVQRGTWSQPKNVTVGAFLVDEWLPTVDRRAATKASYAMVVNKWLVPRLGGVHLPSLTASDVQRALADLRERGSKDGGELSPRSVQLAFTILRKALQHAVALGFIPRNPTAGLSRPSVVRHEMKHWTAEQARAFLQHVADDRLHAVYALALLRGFRRSELAGLRWTDVDLDAKRIHVGHTRIMVDGHAVESTPKTSAGRRLVPLDDHLVSVLKTHRRRQLEERLAWGEAWTDSGYLFVKEDGTVPPPEYFSASFERAAKASGLPVIRFHDTRHTAATLALRAGIPTEVVSKWLGHASPSITQDIYQHTVPTMLEEAGAKLTALVVG